MTGFWPPPATNEPSGLIATVSTAPSKPVSGGSGWVLSRDLEHYTLHQLLNRSPWPLPRPGQLPDKLADEVWYPGLRRALELLNEEQAALFSGSLGQWLRGADYVTVGRLG